MSLAKAQSQLTADLVQADKVIAPARWSVEIANALTSNIRRKRLGPKTAALILDQIAAYDIELVEPPSISNLSGLLSFAEQYQLTAYDAAYHVWPQNGMHVPQL